MIVYTFCPMAVIRWPVLIIQDMSLAGYRTNKPANVESTLLKGKSSINKVRAIKKKNKKKSRFFHFYAQNLAHVEKKL